MKEIYEFIALAKFFIWLEIGITILFAVAALIVAIRKRMFKFAFRKSQMWDLEEQVERLASRYEKVESDIEALIRRDKELSGEITNVESHLNRKIADLIGRADQRLNEIHSSLSDYGSRIMTLEIRTLPTEKQYRKQSKSKRA